MSLITILRHAPVAKKFQKHYIGHSDISIEKALVDIRKLKVIKKRDYDYIFSSDLKRCTQTLDLLQMDYKKDLRLREVDFKKEFEKKSFNELKQIEGFDSKYLQSLETWHDFICKESFKNYKKRVSSFVKDLPFNKNILICSHGGTIRMLNHLLSNNYDCTKDYLNLGYLDKIDIHQT